MEIQTLIVGELDTNCYILKKGESVIIIDPGADFENIKKKIGNSKVVGVIVTHSHFDHIGALSEILKYYSVSCFNYYNMKEGINKIGSFEFEVIYTPGHKDDLISIYFKQENILFSGDFIFKNSIGRYDFEDSSFEDMKKSIKKIFSYSPEMTIFPGHGPKTNLKSEYEMLKYYLESDL